MIQNECSFYIINWFFMSINFYTDPSTEQRIDIILRLLHNKNRELFLAKIGLSLKTLIELPILLKEDSAAISFFRKKYLPETDFLLIIITNLAGGDTGA